MQRNLGANAGMGYAGLGALLRFIAGRSLQQLEAAPEGRAQRAEAAPAAAEATAAAAAVSFGSPWYHVFCLQRAGLVLRELLAAQRHIDSGCLAAQQHQQQRGHERMAGSRRQLQPELAEEEGPPHAEEVAANSACLARIEDRLRALGIPL